MSVEVATNFLPNSDLAKSTGFLVNWPSRHDLVRDDYEYQSPEIRPFVWGINPQSVPNLGILGLGPTEISVVHKSDDDQDDLRTAKKNEIFVPSSVFNRDHSEAVRTVIVGSLNGILEPPHVEIEINTRLIASMANAKSWRYREQKWSAPFAHAALDITNGFLVQQLLRSTRIVQAYAGMKSSRKMIPESFRYGFLGAGAAKLVSKASAIGLCALEESIDATDKLASFNYGISTNPALYNHARKTIRQKQIFVPASANKIPIEQQ